MRRYILVSFLLICLLVLSGCNNNEKTQETILLVKYFLKLK